MRIVFFGTPDFAAKILEAIVQDGSHEILAVVSKPDKPQGRSQKLMPTAVKEMHAKYLPSIPLFQPKRASDLEFVKTLKALCADVFVVVAYGEIVTKAILETPLYGCFNIHASLLPLYRGAAPIQRSLLDGAKETGITIIKMDEGMDTGDIAYQGSMQVPSNMNAGELFLGLQSMGASAILEVLNQLQDRSISLCRQEHDRATVAPKLKKEEFLINWKESAYSIHNKVRALSPFPGAFCHVEIRGELKRLKILKTALEVDSEEWVIQTGKGKIALLHVQLEGRPAMPAAQFLRGYALCDFVFK
jgi:methionyl-tRNA formyltransferase